jgi:Zn-finger nucleic acid-binding protein
MQCPVCSDVTLAISSREGIEIDHCPQCRGVWLDRGELDKIIERAAPYLGAAPVAQAPRSGDARRQRWEDRDSRDFRDFRDDDRRRRRRRSFLDDLFDFD